MADEPESQTEHTCPLCLGWFDTKTGLSNHVRGHLKRIGKPISGASKSPLCILTELLQDETEYKNILRVLGARPHFSKHFVSQKFASSDGLFLTSTGIPVKIQHGTSTEGQWAQIRPPRDNMEKNSADMIQSSTFEDLLENRKLEQKMEVVDDLKEARTPLSISFAGGSIPDIPSVKLDPTWNQGKELIYFHLFMSHYYIDSKIIIFSENNIFIFQPLKCTKYCSNHSRITLGSPYIYTVYTDTAAVSKLFSFPL